MNIWPNPTVYEEWQDWAAQITSVLVAPENDVVVAVRAIKDDLAEGSVPVGLPEYTATELGDATDAVNLTNKYVGRQVINSTSGYLMYATGVDATDDWNVVDGSSGITPS